MTVERETSASIAGPGPEQGTTELLRKALGQVRDLVGAEVAVARDEIRSDVLRAKMAAILLAAASVCGVAAFVLVLVAISLAFEAPWLAAVVIAAALVGVGIGFWLCGRKALPTRPLGETAHRVKSDLNQLKDRLS